MATYSYNGHTRRIISVFGTLFSRIDVAKFNRDGDKIDRLIRTPIRYGPMTRFINYDDKLKFENDNLYEKYVETFPKMSFEMTGMSYDPDRQRPQNDIYKTSTGDGVAYNPAPMILNFSLTVAAKTQTDALQIVEQIIPYFRQDLTVVMQHEIYEGLEHDITFVLDAVSFEDNFEDMNDQRVVLYTLEFSAWTHFWGAAGKSNALADFLECGGAVEDFTGGNIPVDDSEDGLLPQPDPVTGKVIRSIRIDTNDLCAYPDVDVTPLERTTVDYLPTTAESIDEVTSYPTETTTNFDDNDPR